MRCLTKIITQKQCEVISILYNHRTLHRKLYISKLARESSTSYSYFSIVIRTLQKKGLLKFSKKGRKIYMELTELGLKFCEHLVVVNRIWQK